jgi:hypothetical protein
MTIYCTVKNPDKFSRLIIIQITCAMLLTIFCRRSAMGHTLYKLTNLEALFFSTP